jgi:glycosyltransferase involved in cell wall biosynthesis
VYLTLSPHGLAFYKDGFLALALKVLGARMVFHMHGKGVAQAAGESGLKYKIYRAVFRNVDIIHLSESLFSDLDGIRDESRSISAVPNGVEPVACNTNTSSDDKVTFVYLSNLVRTKGADVLIRASALLPKEMQRKFEVKIIGKPSNVEYFSVIKNLIDENSYENIFFLGPKYGKDKDAELCSSDVFVLPTRNDCFPLTILEAMSAGLAVISTNEGAIPDIVESGVTGLIIDQCTPEALAGAMMKFIENPIFTTKAGASGKDKYTAMYTTQAFEKKLTSALDIFLLGVK